MTIDSLSRFVRMFTVYQLYSLCGSRILAAGLWPGQYGIQRDRYQWEDVYHQLYWKS